MFQLLEHKAHQLSAQPDLPVYAERIQAEQALGQQPHLTAIAANLCQRLGLSQSWIPRLEALEQSIELSCATPTQSCSPFIAGENGKTICFTSDSYHPAKFIHKLLRENGFSDAHVLSSRQQGASKHEGSLFEHTIATLGMTQSAFYTLAISRLPTYCAPNSVN